MSRRRRIAAHAAIIFMLASALGACGKRSAPGAPPAQASEAALQAAKQAASKPLPPPQLAFAAPAAWQSRGADATIVQPPDLAAETWRVLVTQNKPLQRKTPLWQPLPARETVMLAMQPTSAFRCLVTPVEVKPDANDFGTKLKAWILTRNLLCSADGWRSWTQYPHVVSIAADGARSTDGKAEALLRERDPKQQTIETFVIVRDDEEKRAATTGPPRIMPGVAVHDD